MHFVNCLIGFNSEPETNAVRVYATLTASVTAQSAVTLDTSSINIRQGDICVISNSYASSNGASNYPNDFRLVLDQSGSGVSFNVWSKVLAGGETSIPFTIGTNESSGSHVVNAYFFRNVGGFGAIRNDTSGTTAGETSAIAAITGINRGDLACYFASQPDSSVSGSNLTTLGANWKNAINNFFNNGTSPSNIVTGCSVVADDFQPDQCTFTSTAFDMAYGSYKLPSAKNSVLYVGGGIAETTTASTSWSLDFSTISAGGLGTIQENDIVLVMLLTNNTSSRVVNSISTAGYTQIDSDETLLSGSPTSYGHSLTAYKIMGATPDTTVDFTTSGNNGNVSSFLVFRNVDLIDPIAGITSDGTLSDTPVSINLANKNSVIALFRQRIDAQNLIQWNSNSYDIFFQQRSTTFYTVASANCLDIGNASAGAYQLPDTPSNYSYGAASDMNSTYIELNQVRPNAEMVGLVFATPASNTHTVDLISDITFETGFNSINSGDLVVLATYNCTYNATVGDAPSPTTAGYTAIYTNLHNNQTTDTIASLYYKVLGSGETTIDFVNNWTDSNNRIHIHAFVVRNIDQVSPIIAHGNYLRPGGVGGLAYINPPAVTTENGGIALASGGSMSYAGGSHTNQESSWGHWTQHTAASNSKSITGWKNTDGTTYDPAECAWSASNTWNSNYAFSISLRRSS